MWYTILTTSDVDLEDFYMSEDDPRIEEWGLEEDCYDSYFIGGYPFTEFNVATTGVGNSLKSPNNTDIILDPNMDEALLQSDYTEEEWDNIWHDFCNDYRNSLIFLEGLVLD